MDLELVIEGNEHIKKLLMISQMLSKHNHQIIVVFLREVIILAADRKMGEPRIWAEIDPQKISSSYDYQGPGPENSELDKIYLQVDSKNMCRGLEMMSRNIEKAKFILKEEPLPHLKVIADDDAAEASTEIPVIVLPTEAWENFSFPKDIPFDLQCTMPRYVIFRKYVDVFKAYKNVQVSFRPSENGYASLVLGSNNSARNRASTVFDKIKITDENGEDNAEFLVVMLRSKQFSAQLHSMSILQTPKRAIKCKVKRDKMLKLWFSDETDIEYHFNLPTIVCEDDEKADNESEDEDRTLI